MEQKLFVILLQQEGDIGEVVQEHSMPAKSLNGQSTEKLAHTTMVSTYFQVVV